MPALIPSFLWLINNAQEHADEDNIFITILSKIIHPQSLNGDASGMHETMLSVLGDPLIRFLHDLKRRRPERQDVEPLIENLHRRSDYVRCGGATTTQHQAWADNSPDGIAGSLRAAVGQLCFWTANTGMHSGIPPFSQPLLRACISIKGAKATLHSIVDEVNGQIATGLADAALDVGTAILISASAADATLQPCHLTLRDALQLEIADAPRLFADKNADNLRAETCVRLNRRVETFLANMSAASAEHEQQQSMHMHMPEAMMGDIGLDAATAAAVGLSTGGAVSQAPNAVVDNPLNFTATGTDELQMNIDAALASQPQPAQAQDSGEQGQNADGQLPSAEDDIFGDLMVDDYHL